MLERSNADLLLPLLLLLDRSTPFVATKSKSFRNNITDACCSLLTSSTLGAGVHQVARVRKFSLAVLYAEFIALSSTSDANRKGIPPQCGGGAAQLVHTFTRKCSLQIEVGNTLVHARAPPARVCR